MAGVSRYSDHFECQAQLLDAHVVAIVERSVDARDGFAARTRPAPGTRPAGPGGRRHGPRDGGDEHCGEAQRVVLQVLEHRCGVARIDHDRVPAFTNQPDVVIGKGGKGIICILWIFDELRSMSMPEAGLWLESPAGRYLFEWECARDGSRCGRHLRLQRGAGRAARLRLPARQSDAAADALRRRACAELVVACQPWALPFASASIDLVVLPHVLEFSAHPHQVLREVERVLVPEGSVVIAGLNPLSLWGLRRLAARRTGRCHGRDNISRCDGSGLAGLARHGDPNRGFSVATRRRCGTKMVASPGLHGQGGEPLVGVCRRAYVIQAVKRVQGMRLIMPNWRDRRATSKALTPVVQRHQRKMQSVSEQDRVDIYTDGACSGEPGPGGWGAILRAADQEKEIWGRAGDDQQPHGDDGRHQGLAVAEAARKGARLTDSQYVQRASRSGSRAGRRGWMTAGKTPVKNADLWKALDSVAQLHEVEWLWVPGHAGHPENERADELARRGAGMARKRGKTVEA